MSERSGPVLTFPELFRLPVTVDMRTAAQALGISPATAYRLACRNAFPCALIRPGRRYRVPTSALMRTLGVEEQPVYLDDFASGAEFAARFD